MRFLTYFPTFSGAWIVFSAYMIYKFGGEIVAVLTAASGRASKND